MHRVAPPGMGKAEKFFAKSICTVLGLFLITPAMNVYLINAGREFGMGAMIGVYSTL
jgi:hypothetical protein